MQTSGSAPQTRSGASGRRRRGRRPGRKRRNGEYTPYEPPLFEQHEMLYFPQTNDPDNATKLDAPGIKSIAFGLDFNIKEYVPLAFSP